ncbi:glycosyltransferase family 4 protein [Pedobacter polaris]|uniref:Glycosyltransferase family 4 protein n=2 Tax=Pedobacter polaris TaxID=2571273 RepID=A0A4V5NZP1_9SPHI|nr:glycosyltransferase family 4 protein [Pedobacter polaris]
MQRVRMSLPYFNDFDWETEVVTVDENYVDFVKDPLLIESIPNHIIIHKVKAFSKKWTAKFGLGSIALRSLWFYRKKVDELLCDKKYDLIYFSTTQFPVCILGAYWKKKFNVPYVIDMQDPWYSDFYQDKPKAQRPKKYWFSYRLNKYLEPIAMKSVAALISVSDGYIKVLEERYPHIKSVPSKVITFGAFDLDFKIAANNDKNLELAYTQETGKINLVYIGRGGYDMQQAIKILFEGFKCGIQQESHLFNQIHFHFIGTSYAPNGKGVATLQPIAESLGIGHYVTEYTDRIGFYHSIKGLLKADGLIIIGSSSPTYTASKLYPYILAKKPLLGIFHPLSSAGDILKECNAGHLITLDQNSSQVFAILKAYLQNVIQKETPLTNWQAFEPYTASFLTKKQVDIFNAVVSR